MDSQPSDPPVPDLDARLATRGVFVLATFVALAVVLFAIGILAGGLGLVMQHATRPVEIIEAMRTWSGTTFVVLSVGIVLLAPYVTMLTVAGWSVRTKRTRLWFVLGTLSMAAASLVGAWLAR